MSILIGYLFLFLLVVVIGISAGVGTWVGMTLLRVLPPILGPSRRARIALWSGVILLGLAVGASTLTEACRVMGMRLHVGPWAGPPLPPQQWWLAVVGSLELAVAAAAPALPLLPRLHRAARTLTTWPRRSLWASVVVVWATTIVVATWSVMLPGRAAADLHASPAHTALACIWATAAGILVHGALCPASGTSSRMRLAHALLAALALTAAALRAWLALC